LLRFGPRFTGREPRRGVSGPACYAETGSVSHSVFGLPPNPRHRLDVLTTPPAKLPPRSTKNQPFSGPTRWEVGRNQTLLDCGFRESAAAGGSLFSRIRLAERGSREAAPQGPRPPPRRGTAVSPNNLHELGVNHIPLPPTGPPQPCHITLPPRRECRRSGGSFFSNRSLLTGPVGRVPPVVPPRGTPRPTSTAPGAERPHHTPNRQLAPSTGFRGWCPPGPAGTNFGRGLHESLASFGAQALAQRGRTGQHGSWRSFEFRTFQVFLPCRSRFSYDPAGRQHFNGGGPDRDVPATRSPPPGRRGAPGGRSATSRRGPRERLGRGGDLF